MSKTLKDLMKKDFDKVRKEGFKEAFEEGRKEGLEESRKETIVAIARNVMNKFGISATEALEAIGVPQDDYAKYLALL